MPAQANAQVIALQLEKVRDKIPLLYERDDILLTMIQQRGDVEKVSSRNMRLPLQINPGGKFGAYNADGGDVGRGSGTQYDVAQVTPVPFRSTFPIDHGVDPFGSHDAVVLAWGIRALYPSWDLLGRPALPASLADADIVHATNPAAVPPVHDDQRLVVTVHDLAFQRFPELFPHDWRWLYRAGLRAATKRADAILVPSQSTADDLTASTSIPASRVHVTPLAPSLVSSDQDPAETGARLGVTQPYVLSVGTLEPRKNLVRLVRAYRQVAPDVPHALVLAGAPGWRSEALDAELARNGPGTVVRTGSLSGVDLDALYRGADVFAYPSLYEGFGLPVLEAMSRGVPTLASNVSSLPQVAGDAALLVDPTDVAEIAEGLARLLTEPAFAEDLRQRGLQRAATFTWAATARATLDVYRHLTGASS
jgi:glycosyltransferase involved in cell wall biosynthesis